MNLKAKLLSMTAAGVLVTGLAFAAAEGHHGGFRNPERRLSFLTNQLSLSDTQQATAKDIFSKAREEAKPIMQQLKQGREAVAAAVKAGRSDAEIAQLSQQQGVLMGQLAAVHSKAMAHFYAQLTPEQKTKADAMHDQMKSRMQQFHQRNKTNN